MDDYHPQIICHYRSHSIGICTNIYHAIANIQYCADNILSHAYVFYQSHFLRDYARD